jgi:hypothetical protein
MSNTINMRTFGLKMIAGAAIVGTMTIATGTSAQAAGLTGRFDFIWNADAGSNSIDFKTIAATGTSDAVEGDFISSIQTGSFLNLPTALGASIGQIKDLSDFSSISAITPVANFINFDAIFGLAGRASEAANYRFNLTSFAPVSTSQSYLFSGFFGDGTLGEGELTTQISGMGLKAYSATLVAKSPEVPTPVLLPGLIGIGMAAMRKRQSKTATA